MPGQVTVACKLPNGLILRAFQMTEHDEPVMGGGLRTVKSAASTGVSVKINGNAVPFGKSVEHSIVGGFALTHGVDADFFAEWMKQNKDSAIVREGLIFAHAKPDEVKAEARKNRALRSGLEPINPKNLPKGIEAAKAA